MTDSQQIPIFRPATIEDIPAIKALVKTGGPGMTTLPKDQDQVTDYVSRCQAALSGDLSANKLLFIVELNKKIVGISGIVIRLDDNRPFYSFKRSSFACRSSLPKLSVEHHTIQLSTELSACSELATLFLAKEARGGGVGKLLSLGRLAFIAAHRSMFRDSLIADIRGWVDEYGVSPFWRHVTSRFIDIDFETADQLSSHEGDFIPKLLPTIPILLNLIPQAAIDAIGRPHDQSAAARSMLQSIGFQPTNFCDIFDAGPTIICRPEDTLIAKTIKHASAIGGNSSDHTLLHFTGQASDFRAVLAPGDLTKGTTSTMAAGALTAEGHADIFVADIAVNKGGCKPTQSLESNRS